VTWEAAQVIESYKAKIDNNVMRDRVAAVLDPIKSPLIIDCRSSTYKPEDLYAIVSEKYPCALTPSDGDSPWVLEVIAV
jgi:hypothetical protein